MSFQIQLADLATQKFKAPVCIRVPTNAVDDKGNTVMAEAHFVGSFQCVPVEKAREDMREMERLREEGSTNDVLDFAAKQLERDFIGFEPHPKHPFPFLDGDQPVACTPEAIKQLLRSKEARDAIQDAYQKARSGDVAGKNSKK